MVHSGAFVYSVERTKIVDETVCCTDRTRTVGKAQLVLSLTNGDKTILWFELISVSDGILPATIKQYIVYIFMYY